MEIGNDRVGWNFYFFFSSTYWWFSLWQFVFISWGELNWYSD